MMLEVIMPKCGNRSDLAEHRVECIEGSPNVTVNVFEKHHV